MTNAATPDSTDTPDLHLVTDDLDEPATDGRTLRRRRNRDAVIEALIDLIGEGDLDPTVAKIADRAEVSHRSVFRYFEDLDDLARTAIETAMTQALPLGVIEDLGEGSLEHRIDQIVDCRIRILTPNRHLMRVATARSATLAEIEQALVWLAQSFRDQVRAQFAEEFSAMDPDAVEHLASNVSALLGFPVFDHQTRLLGRDIDDVARSWRLTLHSLLG